MGQRATGDRPVWGHVGSGVPPAPATRELDRLLPAGLARLALTAAGSGEMIFPYLEALQVIEVATHHGIAVLGAESFEVREDGAILAVGYSEYEYRFGGDWPSFVAMNNSSAQSWIQQHPVGENQGYILTATSQSEFAALSARVR